MEDRTIAGSGAGGRGADAMASIDALLRAAAATVDPVDAALLMAHAAGRSRTWVMAHGTDAATPALAQRFEGLRARRAAGEPLAYLVGRRGFWTLELQVGPDTLIPRAETERLVELALERLPRDRALQVADLGTGSGAIALALASERPLARVLATDASPGALAIARANAASLGIANVAFRGGHWLAPLAGERFHLLASNPPYIAFGDPHLGQGDLRFEPAAALSSGVDGLDAIREIVAGAPAHLLPGGWLLLEHGMAQGAAVRDLLARAGLAGIGTGRDLEGRERVSFGRALQ